jgi:hypothetical protein
MAHASWALAATFVLDAATRLFHKRPPENLLRQVFITFPCYLNPITDI